MIWLNVYIYMLYYVVSKHRGTAACHVATLLPRDAPGLAPATARAGAAGISRHGERWENMRKSRKMMGK